MNPVSATPAAAPTGVRFENVSKFYGEVLGVNRIDLEIGPGITSLVGPNGSGKTTLMNLATGLLAPTEGAVSVLGIPPSDPERLFAAVGYCTQFDTYPRGIMGWDFVHLYLELHGLARGRAAEAAQRAIAQAGVISLSLADQERFAAALLSPPRPNAALKRAFARRRKLIASS